MARPVVGTLAWAERTGGRLGPADRLRLVGQGILLQLGRIPETLLRRLGLPGASAPLDLAPLAAPDTAAARAAERALESSSPPPLVHHCYRAYAWGRILAARAGRRLDEELFYVACLLHDLALVLPEDGSAGQPAGEGSHCFAVDGARQARRVALAGGLHPERAEDVAEAICLHLNVRVALRHGPEAHYLNAGSALDVVGLGRERIPGALLRQVLAARPREGFSEDIVRRLRREASTRPEGRTHFLVDRFGFDRVAESVRFPRTDGPQGDERDG